jgi:Secretion system C-terminal sorting domain
MKKQFAHLVFIILLLLSSFSHPLLSQNQLPNSSFEDWTTAANGTDSLKNWSSSNAVVINPVKSLYKQRDSVQGTNFALVSTAPFGFVQWNTAGILVNGKAVFSYDGGGGVLRGGTRYVSGGGTPISMKINTLSGKYKYQIVSVSADRGVAEVTTTKYNTLKRKRDTVGIGKTYLPIRNAFTDFTVEINDLMPTVIPDTITTIFYASDIETMPMQNTFSSLFLDDLKLTTLTGVEDKNAASLKVFPNPNNGRFSIEFQGKLLDNDVLLLYNVLGQLVKTVTINQKSDAVFIDNLDSGTYFIQSKQGNFKAQKVIVAQ